MATFRLAKDLGWSQRRVINEMGADEVVDWMAYWLCEDPEFLEKIKNKAIKYKTAEEEAAAIRAMFKGIK